METVKQVLFMFMIIAPVVLFFLWREKWSEAKEKKQSKASRKPRMQDSKGQEAFDEVLYSFAKLIENDTSNGDAIKDVSELPYDKNLIINVYLHEIANNTINPVKRELAETVLSYIANYQEGVGKPISLVAGSSQADVREQAATFLKNHERYSFFSEAAARERVLLRAKCEEVKKNGYQEYTA